jgi:hypothetical protein
VSPDTGFSTERENPSPGNDARSVVVGYEREMFKR